MHSKIVITYEELAKSALKIKQLLILLLLFSIVPKALAQYGNSNPDKAKKTPADTVETKKGWNFGVLPGITYDADNGFVFGVSANIYDYSDGSLYPGYKHFIYAEGSYSTKRIGIIRLFYESDYVIKNHKLLADFSVIPEALSDFYGFNGWQSKYNYEWMNKNDSQYVTKYFYRRKSDLLRGAADLRGKIGGDWYWYGGLGVLRFREGRTKFAVDDNDNKTTELYQLYRDWGLIKPEEADGGCHPYVRAGIAYDTRNQRVNATRGMYIDLFVTYNSAFGKLKDYNHIKINFDFMHFVPIVDKKLCFAYHFATQNTIGRSPYYLNTYQNVLYIDHNKYYGLGGSTTLRGVLKNRIWVPGYAFANVELRYKFWKFDLFRQHFYFGANIFIDAGMVTQTSDFDKDAVKTAIDGQLQDKTSWLSSKYNSSDAVMNDFFNFDTSVYKPHFGTGLGLKIAMNENMVVSFDWAIPFDKQDNHTWANFYICMGYMF